MANSNPQNVIKVMMDHYGRSKTDPNAVEKDIGRYMIGKLYCSDSLYDATNTALLEEQICSPLNTESYETLMFLDDDDDDGSQDDSMETSADEEQTDPDYTPSPKKKAAYDVFTEKEMEEIYTMRYSNKGKTLISFNTIHARFKKLQSEDHLKWVIRKHKNRSLWQKLEQIEDFVINKFQESLLNKCRIHDRDVRRWAMKEAKRVGHSSFKCSHSWIQRFKRKYRIRRRMVTTFVTDKSIKAGKEVLKECKEFVANVRKELSLYEPSKVFNTDQSGFNKEIHTRATLAFIGTRRVEARVKSTSAMTHSYTIQPLVSMDGTLYSPMLVVLQEPNGVFGVRVTETMKRAPNLVMKAGRSHIVTKQIVREWFSEIYFPVAGEKSLLLVDSLPAYKDRSIIDQLKPDSCEYDVMIIPPGGTGYIQPLDRLFFRQWKTFAKEINDHIINEDIDVNMFSRDEIITLQSLIHNQFCNEKFRSFRIESWKLSGYLDSNDTIVNPVKYCFNVTGDCEIHGCDGYSMIKCSYCEKELCFQHFFVEFHAHFN